MIPTLQIGGLGRRRRAAGGAPSAYATWNPADKASTITLTNSNRSAQRTSSTSNTYNSVRATAAILVPSYWEVTVPWGGGVGGLGAVGVCLASMSLQSNTIWAGGQSDTVAVWGANNGVYQSGAGTDYANAGATSIYGFAFDPASGKIWIRDLSASTGAAYFGGGDPAAGTSPSKTLAAGTYFPCATALDTLSLVYTANFGSSAFSGSVPAGFSAGVAA